MKGRLLTVPSLLAMGLLLFTASADAGWIIEQVDTDFPGEVTTYSIKGGRIRVEGLVPGLVVLLDLAAAEGYILDEGSSRYGGGKLSKIEAVMHKRKAGSGRIDEKLISGEKRDRSGMVLPDLRIERTVDAGAVAGFESARYRIFLGEELVEEIWVAPNLAVLADGNVAALFMALDIMTGGTPAESWDFPPGYDEHPDYLEVLNSGFPLRRTLYFVGEGTTEEIRSARETPLPDALFDIPGGMEDVGYKKYLNLFIGMD